MFHNSKTEAEIREEQVFLASFHKIRELGEEAADTKANLKDEFKRLTRSGWTREDVKFAEALLKDSGGKMLAALKRQSRIAQLLGHAIGRQMELVDIDRTPDDERAYQAGWATGATRGSASNPYSSGPQFQKWQEGFAEGTAFVNKALDEAINHGEQGEEMPDDLDDEDDDGQVDLEEAIAAAGEDEATETGAGNEADDETWGEPEEASAPEDGVITTETLAGSGETDWDELEPVGSNATVG